MHHNVHDSQSPGVNIRQRHDEGLQLSVHRQHRHNDFPRRGMIF